MERVTDVVSVVLLGLTGLALWFAVAIGLAALSFLGRMKKVRPVGVAASPGGDPDSPDLRVSS